MRQSIRILIVEDRPTDAELAEREIKQVLSGCVFQRVETREEYLTMLEAFQPDLIVSDYNMPQFDGMTALQLALAQPSFIPTIIWTSALNEDTAVACMKAGATDYVIKEHRKRLGQAVIHALDQQELRQERQRAELALRKSEERYRGLYENASIGIIRVTPTGRIVMANPAAVHMLGYESFTELAQRNVSEPGFGPTDDHNTFRQRLERDQGISGLETTWIRKDGAVIYVRESGRAIRDEDGQVLYYDGTLDDITARKRAEQIQALQLAVTRITAESPSRQTAAPRLLQAICASTGWAVGELWRIDPSADHLRWEAAWHAPDEACAAFVAAGADLVTVPCSEGAAGQAWDTEQIVCGLLSAFEGASTRANLAAAAHLQTVIAIPIEANGMLAVLTFYHSVIPTPPLDLSNALSSIGSQIGQFFERMRAEEQLRQYAQQLTDAHEQERARIARELHDEIGQALALIKLHVRTVQRLAQTTDVAPRLGQSLGIVEETLQRVRSLALDLRPSMLDDLGLAATLQWYVERQAGWADWTAEVRAAEDIARLPRDLETVCFRVAQEALNNVARHAQAQSVHVELWRNEVTLYMQIHDNGIGFEVRGAQERARRGGSAGLLGMRERVALAGGQLAIDSKPGQGTVIRVRLPLNDRSHTTAMRNEGRLEYVTDSPGASR